MSAGEPVFLTGPSVSTYQVPNSGDATELLGGHALGRACQGERVVGLSGPGCFEASLPKGEGTSRGQGLFTALPKGTDPAAICPHLAQLFSGHLILLHYSLPR